MPRTIIYVHVYMIFDFPIQYRNTAVLCHSECTCLHERINMAVFLVKSNGNTYAKGRALVHIYRVVPHEKKEQ